MLFRYGGQADKCIGSYPYSERALFQLTAGLLAVVFVASHEISQFFESNTRKCFELLVPHRLQAYDDTH